MRIPIIVVALAVLLAACGSPDDAGGGGGDGDALTAAEQADAYLEVIQPPQEGDYRVWISDQVCEDAGAAPHVGTDGTCGPMDAEVEAALAERIPGAVITSDLEEVQDRIFDKGGGVIWHLGPVEGAGDTVRISAAYFCGGLCGGGTTHVIERVDGVWTETGTEGPEWVS